MTPRDNLLAAIDRRGPASVPIDVNFCPSQVAAFKARFGHDRYQDWFGVGQRGLWAQQDPGYTGDGRHLYTAETLPEGTHIDAWGVGHSKGSDAAMHMTRMHHPLRGERTLAEIERFPLPSLKKGEEERQAAIARDLRAQGFAVMAGMGCTVWETAWYIRGMEDLFMDMATDDEKATVHLDRITEVSCTRASMYARAGADILGLGDDIGMQHATMMSVPMWETWLKGRLARIIAAAKREKPDIRIWYHSCGHVIPFIEGLIEAGVEILNPVQPETMDFDEVFRMAKGRLSFWGTVGTQTTLPFGTPADVRAAVRRVVATCGPAGGIVIAPTHLVEPEVPWENLVAMKEEAEAAGREIYGRR